MLKTNSIPLLSLTLLLSTFAGQAWSQNRRAATASQTPVTGKANQHQSAVDVAVFRQGKPARGLIVSSDSQGQVLMAVERASLKSDNAALYERATKTETEQAIAAINTLKERLSNELKASNLPLPLKAFYEGELTRAQEYLDATKPGEPLTTRFMWLEFSAKICTSIRRVTADAQRVAIWAWSEGLTDVATRELSDLQRELSEANIDVRLKAPDLSRDLPPRIESEDQWLTRLAWVRHTFDSGLSFQGTGDVFMQAGAGGQAGLKAADMAGLMQKMMGGNLQSLLDELDPAAKAIARSKSNAAWFQPVVSQVETQGRREFRITRLEQDPTAQAATVETALVAKLSSGQWQIVWSTKQKRLAAEVTIDAEQQIGADPQIKSLLDLMSKLGVNAEAEIKQAIRFGAATMAAQKAADSEFFSYRDRYVQRLDGPPL